MDCTLKNDIEMLVFNKEYEIAEKRIDQYKKIYGDNDEIAGIEAIIYILKGNYIKALESIKSGLKFNIFNGNLYCLMGNIYEGCGSYDRAYLCYENALYNENNEGDIKVIQENLERLEKSNLISVKSYSIILLTYNKLEYTKICIESIRKYNRGKNYEIIVVDNNSTDGTREWLREQKDIKSILNDENKGFPAGCNQGIKIAEKDNDILLLNNDTVIMPNSIFNLRMGLYSDKKVGAAGPVSNNVSYYQQITKTFDSFDGYMNFALENNIPDFTRESKRIKIIGFAFFVKREVLDKIGLLDERFTPGNFEDDDLSFRIIEAGYEIKLCKDSYIHHFGSVSFGSEPNKFRKVFSINRQKFIDKWGFDTHYSCNIRYDIINMFDKNFNDHIKVLEIGCACGATLLEIKNFYPNAELYGIEFNENSAAVAKNFANVQAQDIEKENLDYEEKSFDYIILADVLEHLINPNKAVKNLKKYLKDDGYILASIPNVMHHSVIKGLLSGKWTYEDAGILDRTHLRFFTRDEIIKLFEESGYMNMSIGSNYVYSNGDEEFVKKLNEISGQDRTTEFATYQYLVKVGK